MKILLTSAFRYSEEQMNKIRGLGYEISYKQDERVPLGIDVSSFEAVVCNGLFLYNDIVEFTNLKFIQLTSAGLDRVPLDYINQHGIKISNARGVYSIPIAEWVVLKILETYKKSSKFYKAQSEHKWEKQRGLLELTGKTAAIIGFGSVGCEIAKRLKAFDVKVVGVGRRNIQSNILDEYFLIDDIDEVLKKSDIVILALPLTDETRHIIDAGKIAVMKDKGVLVNVSRGGVIDEIELIEAVKRGKFTGVALDVFEEEPLPDYSRLWDLENVIVTPHNSFVSDRVNERLFELILTNIKDFMKFKQT